MSMYYCVDCNRLCDRDYVGCYQSPTEEFGLICDDCAAERGIE